MAQLPEAVTERLARACDVLISWHRDEDACYARALGLAAEHGDTTTRHEVRGEYGDDLMGERRKAIRSDLRTHRCRQALGTAAIAVAIVLIAAWAIKALIA